MADYVVVTESGSDIHADVAQRYGIVVVPMHVNFGDVSLDDDTFPCEDVYDYYKTTGRLPQTAGSSPHDFIQAFDAIHTKYPGATILYLAYSAATTIAFRSAHLAAEGRDYVRMIDTKSVSGGLHLVVTNVCRALSVNPDISADELTALIDNQIERVRFSFIPGDLDYLRAGGRLSNVAFLGATLLRIKPVVEVLDGKLVATQKLRGTQLKCIGKLVKQFVTDEPKDLTHVVLTYTAGDAPDPLVRVMVEKILADAGAQDIEWVKSGCVIATHAGPGAFGISALVLS